MGYPAKPWTNGMEATEIVAGETYVYDASQSAWVHKTKATLDSDYQVDKTAINNTLSTHTSQIDAIMDVVDNDIQAQIDADSDLLVATRLDLATLTARVDTLDLLSDSEAGRVQSAIDTINVALSMLDSDGIALQAIKTQADNNSSNITAITSAIDNIIAPKLEADSDRMTAIEASIAANSALDAVTNSDHDSDIGAVNATINALAMPVVSASQPTGKDGLLWVNTNDGKLYYWNGVDAFVSIATV